jgi:arylsulfatase
VACGRAGGFDRSLHTSNDGNFFTAKGNFLDDKPITPAADDSGYYVTTATAQHAIDCLKDHAAHHPGKPFFHYIPFIAPHFPLHALPEDIARYRDRYLAGWDAMREARFERQKVMGLVTTALPPLEREVGPPYAFPEALAKLGPGEVNRPVPWAELNDVQRRFQATKMAIHAAMIDRMDREIGRVLDQLRAMGALDNTLILVASDNGASAEIMVRHGGHDPQADPGSAASYLCLGPGFSSACNTPFRRHKTWVHEGGISSPLIVHWPAGFTARNQLRHAPAHVIDIVPTVLAAAGVEKPDRWGGEPIPAAPGRSLVPAFERDEPIARDSLWWLHEGNRALRVGDWKLVAAKGDPWALYDLKTDRAEQHDLASRMPDKVRELAARWQGQTEAFAEQAGQNANPTGVIPAARPLPPPPAPLPSARLRAVTIDDKVSIGYGLALADIDGDGKTDIVLADKQHVVWYRNPEWSKHVMAERLTELDNVCVAALDIDGDGRAEVAAGAGWNPGDTIASGALFYLKPASDPTQRWEPIRLAHDPTIHRIRWARNASGRFDLVSAPLHGRGNRNGAGDGVRILAYHPPSDPSAPWTTTLLNDRWHATHNLEAVGRDPGLSDRLLVAAREGVFLLSPEPGGGLEVVAEQGPVSPGFVGAGEVRMGRGRPGQGMFVATVEPMHGHQVVVYTPGQGPAGDAAVRGAWKRRVIDASLVDGHGLVCVDLLGLGHDQIVAGWRAMNRPGDRVGLRLYRPGAAGAEGAWDMEVLDDNGMACEDLQAADLDGDGDPDLVASGRATKNLKVYYNERPPAPARP